MIPRIVQRSEAKIIGLSVRTSNQAETNPSLAKIPSLWNVFHQQKTAIPNRKKGQFSLGVYGEYENDQSGEYSLVAGVEVSSLEHVPQGMVARIVPPGKYLVFSANGSHPKAIADTWTNIWKYFASGPSHRRAYTVDFEVYDESRPDAVEIYVAIQQ